MTMASRLMFAIYGVLLLIFRTNAIKRYYATESCGHVHGPDELTVIEFDKEVDYIEKKPSSQQDLAPPKELRNTLWQCVIVVRGMPTATGKKYIGVQWRSFHIRDPDINTVEETVEDCGKAYVTMHKGSDTSAPVVMTMCGKDATKALWEWEGSYVTFNFFADFRHDAAGASQPQDCVDPGTVEEGAPTSVPLCETDATATKNYPYPEVHFRVDITSFDYECESTVKEEVLQCNDSRRCLAWETMCDYYFSHNCKSPSFPGDTSDQTRDAPAYCFRKITTTPIPTTTLPPPPPPFDWTPIAAAGGGLLAMVVLIWCCCRPGYLPWRLARLRNAPFFRDLRTCVCCRGPSKCCPCLKCCAAGYEETDYVGLGGAGSKFRGRAFSTRGVMMLPMVISKSPWGKRLRASSLANAGRCAPDVCGDQYGRQEILPAQGYGKDPSNFATDWLKLVTGDGGHLREHR